MGGSTDVVSSLLSILAIVLLTFGTAVFVAAEFSLTALERSTVEANARTGDRRDQLVRRAHRTLSFQLSGAQVGISITTLATGYLAEPVVGELIRPGLDAIGIPPNVGGGLALFLAILIATSLSMVFGELVPQEPGGGPPGPDRPRVGTVPAAVLDAVHPGHPADQRHRQLDPAPAGHRTGRGTACRHARRRNWRRWCATRPAAGRSTRPPHCWCTARCSSASVPPRS